MDNFTFIGKKIQPENYEYIGFCYFFSFEGDDGEYETMCESEYDEAYSEAIDPVVTLLSTKDAKCNCCNHSIKRGNFFKGKSGEIYVTGTKCGHEIMRFAADTKYAKKLTLQKRKEIERSKKIAEAFSLYPTLEDDFEVYNRIIVEIRDKFFKYLKISEKQVAFIHSLANKRRSFESNSKKASNAEKVTFEELEIVSAKISITDRPTDRYSSNKGWYVVTLKLTMKHKDGWLIHSNYGKLHEFWEYSGRNIQILSEEEYEKKVATGQKVDMELLKKFNIDYSSVKHDDVYNYFKLTTEDLKKCVKDFYVGQKIKNVYFTKVQVSNNDPYFAFGKRMKIKG